MNNQPVTPLEAAQDAFVVAYANMRLAGGAASRRGAAVANADERHDIAVTTRAVIAAAARVITLGGDNPLEGNAAALRARANVRAERDARDAAINAAIAARYTA
jgi:hypothetical protein